MNMFEKICLEMIYKVREYVEEGRYTTTLEYIDKKERQVKKLQSKYSEAGKYVDELEKILK